MAAPRGGALEPSRNAANLRTKIVDFRGFDSSIISSSRGGILRSTGNFPESLSQQILVGMILVGRLAVFNTKLTGTCCSYFLDSRGSPGNCESTSLSRDNLSREIGRATKREVPRPSVEARFSQAADTCGVSETLEVGPQAQLGR